MITLEIEPNPNCDAVELRVFHDLEPPRPVSAVRVERHFMKCQTLPKAGEVSDTSPAWHRITGWTRAGTPAPAQAHKVEDSGEGIVWLVTGGNAGLRLQPDDSQQPWRLEDASQWGIPFLLMGDPADIRFA